MQLRIVRRSIFFLAIAIQLLRYSIFSKMTTAAVNVF